MFKINSLSTFDVCEVYLEFDQETARLLGEIGERVDKEHVEQLLASFNLPPTRERIDVVMKLLSGLSTHLV